MDKELLKAIRIGLSRTIDSASLNRLVETQAKDSEMRGYDWMSV